MPAFTFNPNDLHCLNRLVFISGRGSFDEALGGHRSRKIGEGTDFLDFRPYTPGDDFRNVDWNVYGRLRQLFVRQHEAPRQLSVTLLVDCSRSMVFGVPGTKLQQAQRVACALGFVALRGGDRVFGVAFARQIVGWAGPLMGMRGLHNLVAMLEKAPAGGTADLLGTLQQMRARRRCRGLIIIISDFLNVSRWDEALHLALADGAQVLVVQVLDPLDRGVGLAGNLRLRDSESGQQVDVKVDPRRLAQYQQSFETAREALEDFCQHRRQYYLLADTRTNYIELVCQVLRAKAVLR